MSEQTNRKKSYVVVGGWQNPNGVVAVFTDKAVADRYVEATKNQSNFGMLKVLEVPVDPFIEQLLGGLRPYEVGQDSLEAVLVRVNGEPTEQTIWAADPDSARLIAKRSPRLETL